jgi:uncharacterized protein YecE (DUF72 family)
LPTKQTNIIAGCCGFATAQAKYFEKFGCVEIDSSFYQLPKLETAERWRTAAPPGFQYSMKAWQVITHPPTSPTYKRTRLDAHDRERAGHFGFNPTIRWAWDETFQAAKTLGVFLVLFQCPASFRPNKDNLASLRSFFEKAKRGKFHMGWEPRGEWPPELIATLCRELDLIHVVDPFKEASVSVSKIRYYRLHGITGTNHHFTNEELHRLKEMCRGRVPAYCLFNNVSMILDAQRLIALL